MVKELEEIDQNEFQDLIGDDSKLLIIDFWAEWCVPCRLTSPKFAKISENYPDHKFVKINADKEPLIAQTFNIRSIPSFFVLRGKKVLASVNGADMKKVEEMIINEVKKFT